MSFFKKIGELFTTPNKPNAHGDWFYHTKLFSKKILSFYKCALKDIFEGKIMRTAEDIYPADLQLNFSVTDVLSKWGKPRCSFNNNKIDHNIQVLFYRRSYIYENTLFQLQFYNDKLFFVGIEVGKSFTNDEVKIEMLGKILPNFVTGNFKLVNEIPIWQDFNNNFLLIQDDVNLNIIYLNGEYAGDKISLIEEGKKVVNNKNIDND